MTELVKTFDIIYRHSLIYQEWDRRFYIIPFRWLTCKCHQYETRSQLIV